MLEKKMKMLMFTPNKHSNILNWVLMSVRKWILAKVTA